MKRVFELITTGLILCGIAGAEPERRPPVRPGGQAPGKPGGQAPGKPGGQAAGKSGKAGKARRSDEAWRQLDANGDGRVSYDEFVANERLDRMPEEARKQIFARLDKNGDGGIQADEMKSRGHGGGAGGERRRPMWLGEMDRNRDGAISFEEFRRGRMIARLPEPKQREMFERMDRDGNGRIDRADRPEGFHGGMPRLAELDSDQSGGVSFEEFSAGEMAARLSEKQRRAMFDRFDRNGDGQLRPDDSRGPGQRPGRGGHAGAGFNGLDEDGDKTLSFDEFRKAPWIRDLDEDAQEGRFDEIDRDGDLKLTPAELEAAAKRGRPWPEGKRSMDQPGPMKRPDGKGPGRKARPAPPAGEGAI